MRQIFHDCTAVTSVLLQCSCGEVLRVAKAEAGESVPCKSCGQVVSVPSLSQLEKLSEA